MWGPRRGFALGPRQGLCPWTPWGAASPLPQFAKVVARRRQSGFLQLPCSLGFRLAFSATGGARLPPPWPAFEKAGENQLVNFFGFPAECAGPPLIGSGGLGWFEESRGWKGWWMDRLDGGKSQRSGGGGGVWQAGGPIGPHGLPNKRAGPWAFGPGPCSFGTLRVPPPPPSATVPTNAKKATGKPGPTIYGAWPIKRCQKGARQRLHPPGKAAAHALRAAAASSAPPRATASGRPRPLVRDYRRPRRAAARAGPPSAQGSYRTAHPPLPRGVRSAILINNQYYEMRFTI